MAYGAAQLVFYFPNCYIFEKRILGGILMGDNSHMSVRHTIREKGFTYNMIKGKLEKNSIISKGIHPVPQVESFKCNLRSRGYLKDCSTHWELKKPLFTGLLMALNLHNGYLVEKNYLCDDIFVSKYDAEQLEGTLPEKELCRSDSDIIKKIDRDTLKLDNFFGMHVNKDFLVNHGSDDFGADEKFALKIMQQQGIISTNARHGLTSHNEADIIDEESGQQYEVTYEFKTSLSKKKNSAQFDPEMLLVQTIDNPYIHPSESLMKKLLSKAYSPNYIPNLIILNIGTYETTKAMFEELAKRLEVLNPPNINFNNIFVISHDFLTETATFIQLNPFKAELFPCSNTEMNLIQLIPTQACQIIDEQKYLLVCHNIFNQAKALRYDTGGELRKWIKELHIV